MSIRGWSCWECGTTWGRVAAGVYAKVIEGNDSECEHRIHAVPDAEFLSGVSW